MSPFDPRKPPTPGETTSTRDPWQRPPPRQTLSTKGGVTVIVRDLPVPERRPEPEPPPPRVIIFPPGQPVHDRQAFLEALCREHGTFVDEVLARRRDVAEESKKDVRQIALLVLCQHLRRHEQPPGSVRRFLRGVVKKVVRDRKDKWRPDVDPGAEVEEALCAAPDPEDVAELAEEREKLGRYLGRLSPVEADVIRCIDLGDMTIDEAAEALERMPGTVSTQIVRARKKLVELAKESTRETELGMRRDPRR